MYSGHDINVIFNLIKIVSLTVKLPIAIDGAFRKGGTDVVVLEVVVLYLKFSGETMHLHV